ncbi:DUF3137 domain-containing protein, partial [bacterium]|nr:DUF3137 domain-containing protein [bacterium]
MSDDIKNNFHEIYKNEILPQFSYLESERKVLYFRVVIFCVISLSIAAMLACTALVKSFPEGVRTLTGIISFVIVIVAFFISGIMNCKFVARLKNAILPKMLMVLGNIRKLEESELGSIEKNIYKSKLYEFDDCGFEDCFAGNYRGVDFTAAETVLTTEVKDKDGGTRQVTVFNGLMLSLPFNKKISAYTMIAPKDMTSEKSFKLIILLIFSIIFFIMFITTFSVVILLWFILLAYGVVVVMKNNEFDKVKLEDVDFGKEYSVKSEDQVEARYLVTPSFMERFKNLKKTYNSK